MKKRISCLSFVIVFLISSLLGRVGYIIFSRNFSVSSVNNSYVLTIEKQYPTVFYSGGEKMTNNTEKYIAVLKPNTRTITDLHNLFSSSEISKITNELKQGYPIIKEVNKQKISNAKYIKVYKTYGNKLISNQLLLSSSSGLFNYLDSYKVKKIRYSTDALGRMLQGSEGEIFEEKKSSLKGLKTTINKDVEKCAAEASKSINSGCIVIMDVNSSSILSCITKPDSSYVNKCFEQYSAGSVFKIIVALCALENNIDFYYSCNGKTTVGDTEFSCQNNNAHSFQGLSAALANSCNCYFVNLALKLGKEKILNTAIKLGFNEDIVLYNSWCVEHSNLPSEEELSLNGQLALFGFGQGKLTVSPLHMCYALCTIANEGRKNQVKFALNEKYDSGESKEIEYSKEKELFKKENCKMLIEYLRYVVTNGTGKNAEDINEKSAGKTATAQTGQYKNNRELLNAWFAGVYPYDNPKYAIVVMCEDANSGSKDCAPVFRHIVEMLNNL